LERDASVIIKTLAGAPYRWLNNRLHGRKIKFSYCINVPGHEYSWEYPEVRHQIGDFLTDKLGKRLETNL
jgi:hypothetical protein